MGDCAASNGNNVDPGTLGGIGLDLFGLIAFGNAPYWLSKADLVTLETAYKSCWTKCSALYLGYAFGFRALDLRRSEQYGIMITLTMLCPTDACFDTAQNSRRTLYGGGLMVNSPLFDSIAATSPVDKGTFVAGVVLSVSYVLFVVAVLILGRAMWMVERGIVLIMLVMGGLWSLLRFVFWFVVFFWAEPVVLSSAAFSTRSIVSFAVEIVSLLCQTLVFVVMLYTWLKSLVLMKVELSNKQERGIVLAFLCLGVSIVLFGIGTWIFFVIERLENPLVAPDMSFFNYSTPSICLCLVASCIICSVVALKLLHGHDAKSSRAAIMKGIVLSCIILVGLIFRSFYFFTLKSYTSGSVQESFLFWINYLVAEAIITIGILVFAAGAVFAFHQRLVGVENDGYVPLTEHETSIPKGYEY